MSAAMNDKKQKIVEAQWGGVVPARYYRVNRKKKAETEPLVL